MSAQSTLEDTNRIILHFVTELLPIKLDQDAKTAIRAANMILLLTYAGINIGYGPNPQFNDFRGPHAFKLTTELRELATLMKDDPEYLSFLVDHTALMLKPELTERIRKASAVFVGRTDSLVPALRYAYATVLKGMTPEQYAETAYETLNWPRNHSAHEEIDGAAIVSELLAIRDAA